MFVFTIKILLITRLLYLGHTCCAINLGLIGIEAFQSDTLIIVPSVDKPV